MKTERFLSRLATKARSLSKAYGWRLLNAVQASAAMPTPLRRRLLVAAGCRIDATAVIAQDVFIGGPGLRMGVGTMVNVGCFLDGNAQISIADYARLGPYVRVLTGTHTYAHSVIRRSAACRDINEPVIIGRGCWIGMSALILPGVTVAEGCVVGAGAVLVRSTEPNGLYVGNPARRVRDLPTA